MQEPPLLNPRGLVDYTTGGELHSALKCICLYCRPRAADCQEKSDNLSKNLSKRKIVAKQDKNRYNQNMEIIANTSEETIAAARCFAERLQGGDVVLLNGELGAGKTTFTKGIALALGVKEPITSPTFTIIKEYQGEKLFLYHMDMYRLSGDLIELGLEDYLGKADGISVVEWCCTKNFHARVFEITLEYCDEGRKIIFSEPVTV